MTAESASDPAADSPSGPRDAASVRIAAYLRTAILDGEFGPGDFIRQEEVARRLGSSRLPVQVALRMLEVEGLTEHQANRGARVPVLDGHQMDVIYQLRERMEPLVLRESIPRLTEEDLVRATDLVERLENAVGVAEFLTLDRAFHFLTYQGCAIEQLSIMVERLWNSTQHYRRVFMQRSGGQRRWVVDAEHRLLLDAVVRRDSGRAEQILATHIRRTRTELAGSSD